MLGKVDIISLGNERINITQISRKDYYNQNTYVVYLKDKLLQFIVDPGDNEDIVSDIVLKNNIKPNAILLTHGHFDHLGVANNLAKIFNIPCFVHINDVKLVNRAKNYSFLFEKKTISVPKVIKLFEDFNYSIPKIIHTPGHTDGSCCFVIENFVFT